MSEAATSMTVPKEAQREGWNYKLLLVAFFYGFIGQMCLPCLCQVGVAKSTVAFIFDGLFILRIIAARLLKQKDKGWIFYAILVATSALWIELAAWITIGGH